MRIRTLHILGYRHLVDVVIHELGDINVFAGPNNAGKTSIFRAVRETIPYVRSYGETPRGPWVDFGVAMESCPGKSYDFGEFERSCSVGLASKDNQMKTWGPKNSLAVFRIDEMNACGDIFWSPKVPTVEKAGGAVENMIDHSALRRELVDWLTSSFFLWHRRKSEYADTLQKRDKLDPDAVHLAARLDQLRTEKPRAFHEQLERFINAVIPGLAEPTTRRREDGKVEVMFGDHSLEALGGGVEQVLVLALILLGEPDKGGIFVEEPETHLHPDAQHRLIEQILKYLGKRQLFLSTHSPVFLNCFGQRADVFRVTRENHKAQVERSLHRGQQRHVLDELGVRPSSLLQSNCVVWVEGPTESVLVRHWLSLVDEELHEQRHYDFVYTGGSIRTHLGADVEPSLMDLRDIFRVCRHNYFVCDRDAVPDAEPAKAEVGRIQEMVGDHLAVWVTDGYEIEWYFPPMVVAALWTEKVARHLFDDPAVFTKPFYKMLRETNERGAMSAGDHKVEYARQAVRLSRERPPLAAAWFEGDIGKSLRTHIESLAAFIRRANGLPSRSSLT
jgi:predicted ATPase